MEDAMEKIGGFNSEVQHRDEPARCTYEREIQADAR
jgi:hypothetical protein